ncbi:hypothetical protein L218DRAFT_953581 [Marasmius fiardii PR-910]|nr:hypothetical protein L218DRAFT_953581 [Marasmius fiardii PR-910]
MSTAPESTFLQAERALHSFERICNSFPSSNYNSLQAIDEVFAPPEESNQDMNDNTLVHGASCSGSDPRLVSSLLTCELPVPEADITIVETGKSGECSLPSTENCEITGFDTPLPASSVSTATSKRVSFSLLQTHPSGGSTSEPFTDITHMKSVAPLKIVKKNRRASLSQNFVILV